MKAKRTIVDINDFSGGLITNVPVTNLGDKYTPDCMDVYAEGTLLRKRGGISKVNSASVGTGLKGNGFFNWVKNAASQLMVTVFDSTLYKMDLSGSSWDGTFDTISADSANGTPFSDAITHFVSYAGTLIFTTESRDKPQKMLVTDASHFNLEYNGSGAAPLGKYPQVWKDHVWIMNIGAGGLLTEECASISAWSDNDVTSGASVQSTFQSLSTFRFTGGTTNGDDARRTRDIGTISGDFLVEMRTYFDTLKTIASGGYALAEFRNGAIIFTARWSSVALEVYDGSNWKQVGVSINTQDAFSIWKFYCTAGTATAAKVDIYKDGDPVGLQFVCANASTASNGQIDFYGKTGGTDSLADWYLDYVYVNTVSPRTDYVTNGSFENFTGNNADNWTMYPTQALFHFKCNDNAASTTVTDSGTLGINGTAMINATTLNTSVITNASGKIVSAFTFTSASGHNLNINGVMATAKTDSAGTLSFWVNTGTYDGIIFSATQATSTDKSFFIALSNTSRIEIQIVAGVTQLAAYATVGTTTGFHHAAFVQDGTELKFHYDNVEAVLTYTTSTDKGAWFDNIGTAIDTGRIAARTINASTAEFFNGTLDDIRYYSTALTSDERSSIYADGGGTEAVPNTSADTTNNKIGTNSLKLSSTGKYALMQQTISSGSVLGGVSSLLGGWFFGTNNMTYKLRVNDGSSSYDSAVFTANGTHQYQTHSFTPMSGAGTVKAYLIATSSGTIFFDQISIIPSSLSTTSDNSDRVQRSTVSNLASWDGTDSGTNDIITPGDVGITGSFVLQDRMYVTKAHSIHRFTYTGSTPLVDIKQVRDSGTLSPRSIQNVSIPGSGEVVIFLGTDRRLYIFDGFDAQSISDNIDGDNGISSIYMKNINPQALDKCWAMVHDANPWYEIFLPLGSNTVPTHSIIYNYLTKALWPNSNRNFRTGGRSDSGTGQHKNYAVHNTNGLAYLTADSTSDDGSAINGYWTSHKIGSPTVLSKFDQIHLITDSVVATPILSWREDFNTTYTSKTLSASSYTHDYNPGLNNNYIQVKIADNSTTASFKIWDLTLLDYGIGHGQ